MHIASLAPVLSATSREEYIWIMTAPVFSAFSCSWHRRLACGCSHRRDACATQQRDQAFAGGAAAVVAAAASLPAAGFTTRISRQCFVFEYGRDSTISTMSPAFDSFFSSWT